MRLLRSARFLLLAFAISLIPASSYAGVFISVNFGPPVLPVYVQPVCPTPGLMWTPGYWAYGPDGYYWVPGAWVPAPYVGALWTPGYWGWGSGLYVWHPGYWGPHVGYYGGVNYGFGYMGIGFAGGMWHGGVFAYNGAVMHVGAGGAWGGDRVYVDRTIVERNTIINNNHVAYSGGPGGINHPMTAQERTYTNEPHVAATSFQTQHEHAASSDRSSYFNNNHGHPANAAVSRPLQAENHAAPQPRAMGSQGTHSASTPGRTYQSNRPATGSTAGHTTQQYHAAPQSRPAPQSHVTQPSHQSRPAPQEHQKPEGHEKGR
ncbi:MAG: YXWGXW repeat-containing protein [Terracidiphilus sp.]